MKRYCRAQRAPDGRGFGVECERKQGHKGKHKATWREGYGSLYLDMTAKWPR